MKTIIFDTRLRKLVKPLLDIDAITVQREPSSTDSEGNPSGTRSTVLTGYGTITEANEQEQLVAAQRGTQVDKVLATELGLGIQGGDFVTVNGALTFEVIDVDSRRLYARHMLRVVA